MSQIPSQNTLISFPLSKFSWASDPPAANTFSWKHTMQNLVVVFDSFRSNGIQSSSLPCQMLKVVQGTKTLELVDIGEKVRMSNVVVDSARRVGVQLRTQDIPCSALHRRATCTIAIRYNLPDNYVRRIQLKLTSPQDFDATLSILEMSGLNLTDSAPPAVVDGLPVTGIAARSSTTGHSAALMGHVIAPSSGAEGLSSSPCDYVTASESFWPINPPSTRMHSVDPFSETFHPSDPPITEGPIASCPAGYSPSVQHQRLSTALPRIGGHENAPGPARAGPSDLVYLDHPRPSVALTSGNSNSQNLTVHSELAIHSFENQRHAISRTPRSTLWSNAGDMASANQCASNNSFLFPSFIPNTLNHPQRPSTAPFSQMQNDLNAMIPPRRELPFKRSTTASRGNDWHGSSSRPSTSTMDLPPLPEPNFTRKSTSSSDQPRQPQTAQGRTVSRREYPGKGKKPDATLRPESCRQVSGSTTEPLGHRPLNVQIGKPEQARPDTTHGTQFVAPPLFSASPSCAAPDPPPAESFAAPLNDVLERMGPYLDPTFNDKENLASYAALPNEERMRILEGEIIRLIGDESFAQLCEDLGACWQRIGLEI